jgi:hypothetical protein
VTALLVACWLLLDFPWGRAGLFGPRVVLLAGLYAPAALAQEVGLRAAQPYRRHGAGERHRLAAV